MKYQKHYFQQLEISSILNSYFMQGFYELTFNIGFVLRSVIFKMSFWCLHIDHKANEFFVKISALASKKRLNQNKFKTFYF